MYVWILNFPARALRGKTPGRQLRAAAARSALSAWQTASSAAAAAQLGSQLRHHPGPYFFGGFSPPSSLSACTGLHPQQRKHRLPGAFLSTKTMLGDRVPP